jgi:RNA-binding protein 5/10
MAYNREWDQGKDHWNEATWNASDIKPHVRQREEDYHAEGKRRKYNDGVRLPRLTNISLK